MERDKIFHDYFIFKVNVKIYSQRSHNVSLGWGKGHYLAGAQLRNNIESVLIQRHDVE